MTACPNGHESTDPDWCDTCGERLGAPAAAAAQAAVAAGPATPPPHAAAGPSGPTVACPYCSAQNDPTSLFCEDCGYDFTTGQAPPTPPPIVHTPTAGSVASAPQPTGTATGPDPTTPAGLPAEWSLRIEVDPGWYDLRGELSDEPCPPPSLRSIDLVTNSALIGRTSQSRNIHPEIALEDDPGISRRHAQLVRNGDGWTVADVGSTNGTYIVSGGADPTADTAPIAPNTAIDLHAGDRIFLGAWTKITIEHHGD